MKKLILVFVAVFAMSTAAFAQNGNNLGLRLGAGSGTGAEISYQHGFGNNRAEFDLGLDLNKNWNFLHLTGIYQWVFNLTGGLNCYAGLGADLGLLMGDYSGFGLGVDGQLGIEYNFNFPLQISLDFRPGWHFVGDDVLTGFGWGAALGIRYRF